MAEVEESGHHDLCFFSDPPSQECICERLKQAENYARITVMHTVDVDSYEQGQRDCTATHPVLALKEITRLAAKGYEAGYEKAVADAQWLLEEHVDSIGWLALTKMKPNND